MLSRMILAVTTVATLGIGSAGFAGEGSPDTTMRPWGFDSGPIYPPSVGIMIEPGYSYEPAYSYTYGPSLMVEPDLNTGMVIRRDLDDDELN